MAAKGRKVFYQKDSRQKNLRLLPCEHFVDLEMFPGFIELLLSKGTYTFYCSLCPRYQLTWQIIRSLLNQPRHQLEKMERKLQENSRNSSHPLSECPRCSRIVQRDSDGLCVQCPQCPGSDGRDFCFCWDCRIEWKFPLGSSCCSEECRPAELLRSCATINKPRSAVHCCPTVRGCPQCSGLLSHSGGCNNIICPRCGCAFCYRCLTLSTYHEPVCTIVPNPPAFPRSPHRKPSSPLTLY